MKKRLTLVIAVFALFAMTAVSFAANTATISVTSEPIQEKAACDKAGGFAITFDSGTTFVGGDQITFDLDLHTTLCTDIDLEIGTLSTGSNLPHAGLIQVGTPITATNLAGAPITATAGVNFAGSGTTGVLFKIIGKSGSQRVTINVMTDLNSDGTLESSTTQAITFNGATPATDVLTFAFLDQATYTPGAATDIGMFAPDATTGIYRANNATTGQNTLCIDISDKAFTAAKVKANFDSKGDKFTWIPSDPQIAHVIGASSFDLLSCKGQKPGNIILPHAGVQGTASCGPIDNESGAGFCLDGTTPTHRKNNLILRTHNNQPFKSANYQLKLEILVDGKSGENGVYWTNDPVKTIGYNVANDACNATNTTGSAITGTTVYHRANGDIVVPVAADSDCVIKDKVRAVTLLTPASNLNLSLTNTALFVNLPQMMFDNTFVDGKVLSVKVTLLKAPCGVLAKKELVIGTAGCGNNASYKLRFPYFAKKGSYVNAFVLTNYGDKDGLATITIYEKDGDVFEAKVDVKANSLYVALLNLLTVTQKKGTGTFGDEKSYVTVNATCKIDGACMITNPATGESIGYLPREVK